jgi:predicted acyl esterase
VQAQPANFWTEPYLGEGKFMRNLIILLFIVILSNVHADDKLSQAGFEAQHSEALKKLGLSTKQQIEKMRTYIPEDMTHQTVIAPLRDGSALPAEVFLPPGKGPWPVYLLKSHYGRFSPARYAKSFHKSNGKKGRVAYIFMGTRRDNDAINKTKPVRDDNDWELNDSYDAVEWCAKQPWSNGRICMSGGSGHGVCSYAAAIASPPHLVYSSPWSSGSNFRHDWTFHNGVRRGMYNWLGRKKGLLPTIREYDAEKQLANLKKQAEKVGGIPFSTSTGWYDITIEAALNYFEAFGPKGNVSVIVRNGGHVGEIEFKGKKIKPKNWIQSSHIAADLQDILFDGKKINKPSRLVYYVLGDFSDTNAPGNIYKVTNVWPVPNSPTPFYLHANKTISEKKPVKTDDYLSFEYDPKNPVPTVGGNVYESLEGNLSDPNSQNKPKFGPLDQRVLNDRKDILHFASEPLKAPLEITGKLKAEIFLQTDVPDTTITVKIIDIYPDGYEAIVRDSIVMAMYHNGFDQPAPLQINKVYKLEMDLWSIAIIFNKGHRIGIQISGSNSPKYEVHPNSYTPVNSYDNAPVAHDKIFMSDKYPSRIILPVIK